MDNNKSQFIRINLRLFINGNSKNLCILNHQRTFIKINKTQMVEGKKLAVRKCGESAKAILALESAGDLLHNKSNAMAP